MKMKLCGQWKKENDEKEKKDLKVPEWMIVGKEKVDSEYVCLLCYTQVGSPQVGLWYVLLTALRSGHWPDERRYISNHFNSIHTQILESRYNQCCCRNKFWIFKLPYIYKTISICSFFLLIQYMLTNFDNKVVDVRKSTWNNWLCLHWNLLHLHEIVEGLYFHFSLSVCVCVCLSVRHFLWTKFQPNGCTDLDAVFAKWLLTALARNLLNLVTLSQRSRSHWRNTHFLFIILC